MTSSDSTSASKKGKTARSRSNPAPGLNLNMGGSSKQSKAAKPQTAHLVAVTLDSADELHEETSPSDHELQSDIDDAEPMDVDSDVIAAPSSVSHVAPVAPSPALSTLSTTTSGEDIIAQAKARLNIQYAELKEASAAVLMATMLCTSADAIHQPQAQRDLNKAIELRDKLQATCTAIQEALNMTVRLYSTSPTEGNKVGTASTTSTNATNTTAVPYGDYRSSNGVRIKIQPEWPVYKRGGPTAAYDFFDAFARQVVPVLARETFARDGHVYLIQLMKDAASQDLLHTAFEKSVTPSTVVTLDLLETTFFEHCLSSAERENAVTELLQLGRQAKESFEQFAGRILTIMRRLRIQEDNQLVLALIKGCLSASYLNQVYVWHNMLNPPAPGTSTLPKTYKDFCAALSKIPGPEEVRIDRKSDDTMSSSNKDTRKFCKTCNKQTNHVTKDHVECGYCTKPGHTREECHTRKKDQERNSRGPGHRNNDRRNTSRERSHRDRSSRQRSRSRDRNDDRFKPYGDSYRPNGSRNDRDSKGTSNNDLWSRRYHEHNDNNISLNELSLSSSSQALTGTDTISDSDFARVVHLFDAQSLDERNKNKSSDMNPNIHEATLNDFETIKYDDLSLTDGARIIIPLYFDGETYDALLDSGASRSFIDVSVVQRAKLRTHRVSGNIFLGHKEMHVARMGRTDDIAFECNKRSIMASFEVFELKTAFVIGMDLLHRLGIAMSGIEDGRDSAQRLPPPIPDEKPSIVPLTTPEEELTSGFIEAKAAFMSFIKTALEENTQIPHSSHCPIPEMKVSLEVPKGTVLFRRPRIFAHAQQPIFDEQVNKWIQDGVIAKDPAGNPHNNTLTLASRKTSWDTRPNGASAWTLDH